MVREEDNACYLDPVIVRWEICFHVAGTEFPC